MELNPAELALKIATEAHKDQKRWGGEPYISHPIAVAEKVRQHIEGWGAYKHGILAVAYLHDVVEDSVGNKENILANLRDQFIAYYKTITADIQLIIEGVAAITKGIYQDEDYFDYLKRLKYHNYARIVKICDIQHNLESLPDEPKHKNKRDKYRLALYFLEN